jgi:polygalacturonase
MPMKSPNTPFATAITVLAVVLATSSRAAEPKIFNVRDHGATGDGRTLDTAAINKAVEACATAGGGRVTFPPGKYLSGTVHLKSNVELHIEAGATLIGSTDLKHYQSFSPPEMPEAKWGVWHRALVLAAAAKNIRICGKGTIDGNKVFDPHGEEHMRGPHAIVFGKCDGVVIRDVAIKDSANYAIYFEVSDGVEVRNLKVTGGWDGVHFRGNKDRPCRDVTIADCQFFTGDDSIAGRYWDQVRITNCVLNSSCNCVRLIGPATRLVIEKCRMYGPGEHPHRTSNRYNCLAGLNLQPGSWDGTQGTLDDVTISDITMQNVSTPFHFVLKPGNTAGRITVSRVKVTGAYYTASSVESWAEKPFGDVTFRDVSIEFTGGGKREQSKQPVRAPGDDVRPLPAWGFYLHNVKNVTFEQVRLSCAKEDLRPVLMADSVERLTLSGFTFPRVAGAEEPLALKDVKHVEPHETEKPAGKP